MCCAFFRLVHFTILFIDFRSFDFSFRSPYVQGLSVSKLPAFFARLYYRLLSITWAFQKYML